MDNVYSKFFSGNNNMAYLYKNPKQNSEFEGFLPKKLFSQKSANSREIYTGPIESPKIPQYPSFQGKHYSNISKPHSVDNQSEPIFAPNDLKLQILDAKLKNLESKQKEEKKELVELVKRNVFDNPNKYITPPIKKKHRILLEGDEEEDEERKKDKSRFRDNLEEFREEVTRQLRHIKKTNERINVEEILTDLDDLKKKMKYKDLIYDKTNGSEINKIVDSIKIIGEDLTNKLSSVTAKNEKAINNFGEDLQGFKLEMIGKIQNIESKQKKQIQGIKFILENGSMKNKPDAQKIFSGEMSTDNPILEPQDNVNRYSKRNLRNPHKKDVIEEDNEELTKIIRSKKAANENLKKEVLKNEEEHDINLDEWKNKKLMTMKEKMKMKIENQNKQNLEKIKNQLSKFKNNNFRMKRINELRSYVYSVIACYRIAKLHITQEISTRTASLKTFSNYYESFDGDLKNWLFHSVRVPYLSILNFNDLRIDITDSDSIFASEKDTFDKYIKLETRLKGFMEHLIEHTDEKEINSNLLNYLYLVSTNSSYIPQKFYTLFELNRIEFKNDVIRNITQFQQIMILNIYLLCKIFVFHILIEHSFSASTAKNANMKKNFKMVASVFYHEIRKDLIAKNQIIPNNKVYEDNDRLKFKKQEEDKSLNNLNKTDIKYENSYKQYQLKIKNDKNPETEANLLRDINKTLTSYIPDTNIDGLEFIEKHVYREDELSQYFKYSKQNKFDLSERIKEWCDKLYNIIFVKNSNITN